MGGLLADSMGEVPDGFEVPQAKVAKPRPSAALVATRDGERGAEILFCHRVSTMPSFPDFWAFPGGGVKRFDTEAAERLPHLSGNEEGAALAALMREMAEEVAWAPSGRGLVTIDEITRSAILDDGRIWVEAADAGEIPSNPSGFNIISVRTTPPLAPIRFENRFFHLHDAKAPNPILPSEGSEFDQCKWMRPQDVLDSWERCDMRIPPPQITLLRDIVDALNRNDGDMEAASMELAASPPTGEHRIEYAPTVELVPLPTSTLPPSTHTNCYLLGEPGGDVVVVDPAAKDDEAMSYLERRIRIHEELGGRVVATIFTHRHPDHIGDLGMISKIYQAPIWATTETHAVIPDCDSDRILVEGDEFTLGKRTWKVLETPGHCPGHICLSSDVGVVSGDLAVVVGTILVPSGEGDMDDYLSSLKRVRDLDPPLLFPGHGPLSPTPRRLLDRYLKHRQARHARVLEAVLGGTSNLHEIANLAYADTPDAHPILKVDQTISHLKSHQKAGDIRSGEGGWHPSTR